MWFTIVGGIRDIRFLTPGRPARMRAPKTLTLVVLSAGLFVIPGLLVRGVVAVRPERSQVDERFSSTPGVDASLVAGASRGM